MAHLGDCSDVWVSYLWSLVHGCSRQNKRVDWASRIRGYIPRLRSHAGLWSGLAVSFPFLAALLLALGKGAGLHQAKTSRTPVITAPEVSHEWSVATTALAYLLRVAVSAAASLGFMVVFILAVVLLQKPGLYAH